MLLNSILLTLIMSISLVSSVPVTEKRTSKTTTTTTMQGKCISPTSANLAKERAILKAAGSPGLIPLVYDDFSPKTTVNVYYNGQFDPYGTHLSALTDTLKQPDVYFPTPIGDKGYTYTLIMNDPDAPPPLGDPTFLHWIRKGLKPNCVTPSTAGGSDVRPYVSPTPPPPNAHRYVLTILREPKKGYAPNVVENFAKLTTFDIRTFEKETGAKVIGSTYFLGSIP